MKAIDKLYEQEFKTMKENRIFDKLNKGSRVKIKSSSVISKGTEYVEYIVKCKNTLKYKGIEKITLVYMGNEHGCKRFLYKRDGYVTFAMGDMAATIDDIKV
mgnify:CR=1 FL=1|tara:strand:- start:3956 stop:4261 length:306 start_codon:yes stop_codon:yes gene_type:complete